MYTIIIGLFLNVLNFQQVKIKGTYKFGDISGKKGRFGMITIHQNSSFKTVFYLDLCLGEPNYNIGALYGLLSHNKKTGHYQYIPQNLTEGCKLDIEKKGNKILIKTGTGDCGFGNGVYADGTYRLTDPKNPRYFINGAGTKVYFDKTSPEDMWR